jgi:adenine deaminase
VGVGFVRGFHLSSGAIGSTVAHDAHNTVIAGTNDADIIAASNRLTELQGGVVVVDNGVVLAELALPIAGILSNAPAAEVAAAMDHMHEAAATIGVDIDAPFMVLSFLALSVIPDLKLTDRGYVDVNAFELVGTVLPTGNTVLN